MRDPEVVEAELVEISAMADDETKLNNIIAWCATHPDEIPFAIHILMGGAGKKNQEPPSGEPSLPSAGKR
jgi:hypothetical protein